MPSVAIDGLVDAPDAPRPVRDRPAEPTGDANQLPQSASRCSPTDGRRRLSGGRGAGDGGGEQHGEQSAAHGHAIPASRRTRSTTARPASASAGEGERGEEQRGVRIVGARRQARGSSRGRALGGHGGGAARVGRGDRRRVGARRGAALAPRGGRTGVAAVGGEAGALAPGAGARAAASPDDGRGGRRAARPAHGRRRRARRRLGRGARARLGRRGEGCTGGCWTCGTVTVGAGGAGDAPGAASGCGAPVAGAGSGAASAAQGRARTRLSARASAPIGSHRLRRAGDIECRLRLGSTFATVTRGGAPGQPAGRRPWPDGQGQRRRSVTGSASPPGGCSSGSRPARAPARRWSGRPSRRRPRCRCGPGCSSFSGHSCFACAFESADCSFHAN